MNAQTNPTPDRSGVELRNGAGMAISAECWCQQHNRGPARPEPRLAPASRPHRWVADTGNNQRRGGAISSIPTPRARGLNPRSLVAVNDSNRLGLVVSNESRTNQADLFAVPSGTPPEPIRTPDRSGVAYLPQRVERRSGECSRLRAPRYSLHLTSTFDSAFAGNRHAQT
jgi:hypothetical protein